VCGSAFTVISASGVITNWRGCGEMRSNCSASRIEECLRRDRWSRQRSFVERTAELRRKLAPLPTSSSRRIHNFRTRTSRTHRSEVAVAALGPAERDGNIEAEGHSAYSMGWQRAHSKTSEKLAKCVARDPRLATKERSRTLRQAQAGSGHLRKWPIRSEHDAGRQAQLF